MLKVQNRGGGEGGELLPFVEQLKLWKVKKDKQTVVKFLWPDPKHKRGAGEEFLSLDYQLLFNKMETQEFSSHTINCQETKVAGILIKEWPKWLQFWRNMPNGDDNFKTKSCRVSTQDLSLPWERQNLFLQIVIF